MAKELKFFVENFGPVSEGEIVLKPLTIFVGPNTSGKSYICMLIYSILMSINQTRGKNDKDVPPIIRFIARDILDESIIKNMPNKLISEMRQSSESFEPISKITDELTDLLNKRLFQEVYEKKLTEELSYSFSSQLSELTSIGQKKTCIRINFNNNNVSLVINKDNLKLIDYKVGDIDENFKEFLNIYLRRRSLSYLDNTEKDKEILDSMFFTEALVSSLIIINIDLFKNLQAQCYYLPAARSGLFQMHRTLIDKMVKKSTYSEMERPVLPRLAGVIANFISTINNLPDKKSDLYNLVMKFESEIIRGELLNRKVDGTDSHEIKYIHKNKEIPLHLVSSTISELAPIILYLKYVVSFKDTLIIEEPESHLHPGNQRLLARLLVNLVRKGVNIIITTHSPYLIEQLSRFIMLSKVDAKKRVEKYKYDPNEFLVANEVATYMFKYSKNDMFKIENLEITTEGIPQDEFTKIDEILYEEFLRIQRDLNDFA